MPSDATSSRGVGGLDAAGCRGRALLARARPRGERSAQDTRRGSDGVAKAWRARFFEVKYRFAINAIAAVYGVESARRAKPNKVDYSALPREDLSCRARGLLQELRRSDDGPNR
jgi:hypothetical protein